MKITRSEIRKLINEAMSGDTSNPYSPFGNLNRELLSIRLKDLDIALAIAIIGESHADVDSDLGEYTYEYRESVKNHLEELKELCESGDSDIIGKLYMKKQEADANGDIYINDTIERIFDDATEVG